MFMSGPKFLSLGLFLLMMPVLANCYRSLFEVSRAPLSCKDTFKFGFGEREKWSVFGFRIV